MDVIIPISKEDNHIPRLRRPGSTWWYDPINPKTSVTISIHYARVSGRSDAANIIGGIADALQGILYKNDRQIRKVRYSEDGGASEEYVITINYKGQPLMLPHVSL